jgi:hypothetical protein
MAVPVKLTINNADNELAAFVNCVKVYDKKTEGNPSLKDEVDLTPFLTGCCCNCLTLVGINWGGPATFKGKLTIGTLDIPFSATFPSTPNGICWEQTFAIPYCCP